MDLEKLREMYRELENIRSPEVRWLRGRLTVDQIEESGISLPEKAKFKFDVAKGLFTKDWDIKIFDGENAKDSINDLKEVLRTIYSMVEDGTTGDEMADESELTSNSVSSANMYVPDGGMRRKSQTARFCSCIKSVRKTLKARKGSTKEQGAIAVCVKSVLHTKGKTIKKFKCGKKMRVVTQKRK